ncbi:MAG: hypothetical protein ABIA74_02530 [bacterium]
MNKFKFYLKIFLFLVSFLSLKNNLFAMMPSYDYSFDLWRARDEMLKIEKDNENIKKISELKPTIPEDRPITKQELNQNYLIRKAKEKNKEEKRKYAEEIKGWLEETENWKDRIFFKMDDEINYSQTEQKTDHYKNDTETPYLNSGPETPNKFIPNNNQEKDRLFETIKLTKGKPRRDSEIARLYKRTEKLLKELLSSRPQTPPISPKEINEKQEEFMFEMNE